MRAAGLGILMLVCAVAFSTPPAWALRDSRASLAQGTRIPLEVAIAEARATVPGQAIDAEIGEQNGRVVYEIQILDQAEQTHTVFVDAHNGQILTFRDGYVRDGHVPMYRDEGPLSGAPRDSQPGMSGTNSENPGTNSGSTEDGGSGDRIHVDQSQGGRS